MIKSKKIQKKFYEKFCHLNSILPYKKNVLEHLEH